MLRFFLRLEGGNSLDYKSVIYFKFLIGPGVGVDQEPRVGFGIGTAPPLLRTPGVWIATHKPTEGIQYYPNVI